MELIYVSAPYSHPSKDVVDQRMKVVSEFQAYWASVGFLTASPLEKHFILRYAELGTDYNFWGNLSKCMLRKSDGIFVIELPGWDVSVGVQDEIRIAEDLNIPVTYFTEEFYIENINDQGWEK